MQTDVWYDLILRELSAGLDAGEERRREAAEAAEPNEDADDDEDGDAA
jgi:hypothetical protein